MVPLTRRRFVHTREPRRRRALLDGVRHKRWWSVDRGGPRVGTDHQHPALWIISGWFDPPRSTSADLFETW